MLIKGISAAFIEYLSETGFCEPELKQKLQRITDLRAKGKMPYDEFSLEYGKLLSSGLKGRSKKGLERHAKKFFNEYTRKNIYASSYKLVKLLKDNNYCTIIISAGIKEIILLAGKDLGADEVYATKLQVKDGIFNGHMETALHTPIGKAKLLSSMSNRFNLQSSMAFGDAMPDARMMELVGIPVALNPTTQLRKLAKEKGWAILDYKNVVAGVNKLLLSKLTE